MTGWGGQQAAPCPTALDAAGQFDHKARVAKLYPSQRASLQAALLPCAALVAAAFLACGNADNTRSASVVPEWQQVADGLESSSQCCFRRDGVPTGAGAGAPEMHLPLVALTDEDVIEVSFEADPVMTAEHWITTLYVRDQDAVVIGYRDFGQSALLPQFSRNEVPSLEFPAPLRTEWVRAFSYCNLHQHWASDGLEL